MDCFLVVKEILLIDTSCNFCRLPWVFLNFLPLNNCGRPVHFMDNFFPLLFSYCLSEASKVRDDLVKLSQALQILFRKGCYFLVVAQVTFFKELLKVTLLELALFLFCDSDWTLLYG